MKKNKTAVTTPRHFDGRALWRTFSLVSATLLLLLLSSTPSLADTPLDQTITLDIPANTELEEALITWGTQARVTVMMNTAVVRDRWISGIRGTLTARKALAIILQNSGLSYTQDGDRVRISPTGKQTTSMNADPGTDLVTHLYEGEISDGVSSAGNADQEPQSNSGSSQKKDNSFSEVIVSAQKREERLQDVPVPVTAVSAEALTSTNQLRLQDYYASVPGLSISPGNQSSQFISIRGINTGGFQNPLVGVVIDDVPFGSSTELGGGYAVPDIDPSDLARVEVLRGPQGTLYGASSLGGLIKFVTVDPSTDSLNGRVEAGSNGVYNGAEAGYNFRASANVPLGDTFAIRASAFTRQDPGYINNPTAGMDGVNEAHYSGTRLSGLWKPTETVSLKLSALYQVGKGDGPNFIEKGPGLTGLEENDIRGLDGFERKVQAYDAILNAKIGVTDLTVLTGYNVNSFFDTEDVSFFFGPPGSGVGAAIFNDNRTRKFTEEVRLNTPIGSMFEFLVGGFYTHESSDIFQNVPFVNPSTGAVTSTLELGDTPTAYTEYAGFADLTTHITDSFDIQIGGREGIIRQTQGPDFAAITGLPTSTTAEFHADGSAFTYLFTPQYKISSDVMVYARLASGYRAGGVNVLPLSGELGYNPALPRSYSPDKTNNYEIGTKGSFFQNLLSVDASVYYISWKDFELSEVAGATGYTTNGGRAKSQGLELSVDVRPFSGLTLSAWGNWNEAVLTQALPSNAQIPAYAGQPLPYSNRFSGHFSVDDEFELTGKLSGFLGAELNYVGQRPYLFSATPKQVMLPAYAQLNAHSGIRYGTWTVNLYANNVTNRFGVLGRDLNPASWYFIQPRTIGGSVVKTF